jgi:oligopeptide/dipeptide ABC transporter ATP-binding protein
VAARGSEPVLQVSDLCVEVGGHAIIDEVSLQIAPGEMLGLVGESGCGKSVTALAVMRLLAEPPMRVARGSVYLAGRDLMALDERALRRIRGRDMAMIFQEPMTSLNPVFTIGDQIAEAVLLHTDATRAQARDRARALLERVGIPAPGAALDRYPHQLSGGQRQRVMIAMALSCGPELLVADEPTTALDVTVQAQILDLLDDLRRETGMAVLLITHDLGVVSQYCDRVAVMYGGRVVETAPAADLFAHPRHRYTQALLRTIPAANPPGTVLPAIPGSVPPPGQRPQGCAFHPRCTTTLDRCRAEMPPLTGTPHAARCWNPA